MQGALIVVEGIDGSENQLSLRLLEKWLISRIYQYFLRNGIHQRPSNKSQKG